MINEQMTSEEVIKKLEELCEYKGYNYAVITDKDVEALHTALEILRNEKPKGEWIPVSEKLPERYKEVIVTDIETTDTYQSRYIGNGYWECDNGTLKNRIIAWQPLPKPYKMEADNAPTVESPCNNCIELECENHGVVCPHYRADMRETDND